MVSSGGIVGAVGWTTVVTTWVVSWVVSCGGTLGAVGWTTVVTTWVVSCGGTLGTVVRTLRPRGAFLPSGFEGSESLGRIGGEIKEEEFRKSIVALYSTDLSIGQSLR